MMVVDRRAVARRAVVLGVAAVFLAPGLFVAWRAAVLGASIVDLSGELAGPAWRSTQLAVFVGVSTAVLGTALAWLATCTDLPGRRMWRIVLVLPIVLPSFAGTTAVLAGFTRVDCSGGSGRSSGPSRPTASEGCSRHGCC